MQLDAVTNQARRSRDSQLPLKFTEESKGKKMKKNAAVLDKKLALGNNNRRRCGL